MHRATFAAALVVALITAPMPQFVSTAVAQQQAATQDKNAKTKKEPSAGQQAARDRQKSVPLNGRKRKPPTRLKRVRAGRNSGATATSVSSPHPNKTIRSSRRAHFNKKQNIDQKG
jgi:hypothetical protein